MLKIEEIQKKFSEAAACFPALKQLKMRILKIS
mgnify:CR=1 FL=1